MQSIIQQNLRFEYLHRDEGNYKTFGQIIVHNPQQITSEQATLLLRKLLIDQEFFEPEKVKIPLFPTDGNPYISRTDRYKFHEFSCTNEKPTDSRTIEQFINAFE